MKGKNYKIVIVGDEQVGKTSLIRRFVEDKFSESYVQTLGFEISVKSVPLAPNHVVVLSLWDVGGEARFKHLQKRYYEGARGIVVAFDATRLETLDHVPEWVALVREVLTNDVPLVLVGTKLDLLTGPGASETPPPESAPTPASDDFARVEGEVANRLGTLQEKGELTRDFVETVWTSAKSGENVPHLFETLARLVSTQ